MKAFLPTQSQWRLKLHHELRSPLTVAALITWLAVALSVASELNALSTRSVLGMLALAGMAACFIGRAITTQEARGMAWIMAQGVLVVASTFLVKNGMAPVLLIVVAAQAVATTSVRRALLTMLLLNCALLAVLLIETKPLDALVSVLALGGFQAFAGLTAFYALEALISRDQLAASLVELASTSQLLAQSARLGERLDVSRELHDVAGHKLTALNLFLNKLIRDGGEHASDELRTCKTLASELLGDIRQVVSQLRVAEPLELNDALLALGQVLPEGALSVVIEDNARPKHLASAQMVLRIAQEALTNVARHAPGASAQIRLSRSQDQVTLSVLDSGRGQGAIEFGNGLKGMRERLLLVAGTLEVTRLSHGAVQVNAIFPAAAL